MVSGGSISKNRISYDFSYTRWGYTFAPRFPISPPRISQAAFGLLHDGGWLVLSCPPTVATTILELCGPASTSRVGHEPCILDELRSTQISFKQLCSAQITLKQLCPIPINLKELCAIQINFKQLRLIQKKSNGGVQSR